nr:MAG TPA: hypothetical protein [Caudoviricetes sp.]DAX40019.1 MAG TPA: hypothetical protein [Caudoviricetes sp.]
MRKARIYSDNRRECCSLWIYRKLYRKVRRKI